MHVNDRTEVVTLTPRAARVLGFLRESAGVVSMEPGQVRELQSALGAAEPAEIALATVAYFHELICANRDGVRALRDAIQGAGTGS